MVSVFEKMRFRDLAHEFSSYEKMEFVDGVFELLYGNEKKGFYMLISLLKPYKLAKWPIISVFRAYKNPKRDVFMKPTTVKKILKHLDIDDIKYESLPNYAFYKKYRTYINKMKKEVDKSLSPNNPAFSGFLMVTIK